MVIRVQKDIMIFSELINVLLRGFQLDTVFAFEAELYGVIHDLDLARKFGLEFLWLECYSKYVVDLVSFSFWGWLSFSLLCFFFLSFFYDFLIFFQYFYKVSTVFFYYIINKINLVCFSFTFSWKRS